MSMSLLMPFLVGAGILILILLGTFALFSAFYVKVEQGTALIVNDLKLGPLRGTLALWIGEGTEAYFRNVKWTSQPRGE